MCYICRSKPSKVKFATHKKGIQNTDLLTRTLTVTLPACFVDVIICCFCSFPSCVGMALGYPPPSPVGSYAPLTPISMSAGIDLASSSGGGGSYSPPHNLSPKGSSSSASVSGYNSQVRKFVVLVYTVVSRKRARGHYHISVHPRLLMHPK